MTIKRTGIERLAVGAATLMTTSGWLFAAIQLVFGLQAYRRWRGATGGQDYEVLFSVFQTILVGLLIGAAAHCLAAITIRVTRD